MNNRLQSTNAVSLTTEPRQVRVPDLVATLCSSKARSAVLRLFLIDPHRAYYQRQIEAVTGVAIRGVQRELERLSSLGMLYRRNEGNRTYYQVDTQFPIFEELRAIILKTGDAYDQLRGALALEPTVRVALLLPAQSDVLVVSSGASAQLPAALPFTMTSMSIEAFTTALTARTARIEQYLTHGVDMLGRREDVVWRRIEALGYAVSKGKGVA